MFLITNKSITVCITVDYFSLKASPQNYMKCPFRHVWPAVLFRHIPALAE